SPRRCATRWRSGCSWWCWSSSPRGCSDRTMSDFATFWTPVLITAGINSIIALGLYITMSSWPLPVAHAALAGMGGYLGAVLTTNFGWPFPLAILAGTALGLVTGLLLGLLIVRMNELVAGLTTLGFGETMAVIAFNIDYIGGANAVTRIPLRPSPRPAYVPPPPVPFPPSR